jgi:hypothetical protein
VKGFKKKESVYNTVSPVTNADRSFTSEYTIDPPDEILIREQALSPLASSPLIKYGYANSFVEACPVNTNVPAEATIVLEPGAAAYVRFALLPVKI